MNRIVGIVLALVLVLSAGAALAQTPPGPGQCFNGGDPGNGCSGGCATDSPTCAADDRGCVPDTKDHEKCSAAIGNAIAKAIVCADKCHCKQAAALMRNKPFDEEACEGHNPPKNNACQDKLDGTLAKLGDAGICSSTQLSYAATQEAVIFAGKNVAASQDAQRGNVYCDSTSGAMISDADPDDAGWVPATKESLACACAVGRNLVKLVAAEAKCHAKLAHAFAGGRPFDEESCEETNPSQKGALDKYQHARDVVLGKGICPPCLDQGHQDTLGTNLLGQLDVAAALTYPCP